MMMTALQRDEKPWLWAPEAAISLLIANVGRWSAEATFLFIFKEGNFVRHDGSRWQTFHERESIAGSRLDANALGRVRSKTGLRRESLDRYIATFVNLGLAHRCARGSLAVFSARLEPERACPGCMSRRADAELNALSIPSSATHDAELNGASDSPELAPDLGKQRAPQQRASTREEQKEDDAGKATARELVLRDDDPSFTNNVEKAQPVRCRVFKYSGDGRGSHSRAGRRSSHQPWNQHGGFHDTELLAEQAARRCMKDGEDESQRSPLVSGSHAQLPLEVPRYGGGRSRSGSA